MLDKRNQDPQELVHKMFMVHECKEETCEVCYIYKQAQAELARAI